MIKFLFSFLSFLGLSRDEFRPGSILTLAKPGPGKQGQVVEVLGRTPGGRVKVRPLEGGPVERYNPRQLKRLATEVRRPRQGFFRK